MPELPEVETVCRGLNQLTSGQVLAGVTVSSERTWAYPLSWHSLLWNDISWGTWYRRGKYLFVPLLRDREAAGWLGVHLRMTGQLLWLPRTEPLSPHTRVSFHARSGYDLRFVDVRSFGRIWRGQTSELPSRVIPTLQTLGPEPFAEEFTALYLQKRLAKTRRPIKTSLLDQTLVAGLGNIYADEVLFQAAIHPTTPGSELTRSQLEVLQQTIRQILGAAIAAGGTTFSDFRGVTGINGNYGGQAWVYGRARQPCRLCETPIERLKLGGRSSHFCPHCQRK